MMTTKSDRFANDVLPRIQQQIMAKIVPFLGRATKIMFGPYEGTLINGTAKLPQTGIPDIVHADIEEDEGTYSVNLKLAGE